MIARLKKYLFTGILVTGPVALTFWIVFSLVKLFDQLVTPLIPIYLNPNTYPPRDIPGLGLIVLTIFLVFVGAITANFFGSWILKQTDTFISKIPLIKTFYKTIKQILETILKTNSQAFRDAVLVEYPRKGAWVIGFTPTTPNPTSGFLLMIPKKDLKYLNVSVDEAIKTIVSAGIIELNTKQKNSS